MSSICRDMPSACQDKEVRIGIDDMPQACPYINDLFKLYSVSSYEEEICLADGRRVSVVAAWRWIS